LYFSTKINYERLIVRLRNTEIILSVLRIPRPILADIDPGVFSKYFAISLTTKSVKTRVDNIISGNVIERCVTLVNRHSSAIMGTYYCS
jgi:hypothetical protein